MALIRNSPSRCFRSIFQSNLTNPSKHPCLSLHILHHPRYSGCAAHCSTRHCGINRNWKSTKSDKIWTFFVFICDPPSQIAHQTVKFHIQRPILVTQQKILQNKWRWDKVSKRTIRRQPIPTVIIKIIIIIMNQWWFLTSSKSFLD